MSEIKMIKPLKYWVQKVLPLVYDDSLSYYELLNKVVLKLNELIINNDKLPEYIKAEIQSMLTPEHIEEILSEIFDTLRANIAPHDDGDSTTATTNLSKGTWVWLNDNLYITTRDMNIGDAYITTGDNPNVVRTNVEEQVDSLADIITDYYDSFKYALTLEDDGDSPVALKNRSEGDLLWLDDKFCQLLMDMSYGYPYIKDTNYKEVTVAELLGEISDGLDDEITARGDADDILDGKITDEATAREHADDALSARIDALFNREICVKVEDYGAVGDGVTDDTSAIQDAIDDAQIIYFNNDYLITDTITVPDNKILIGNGSIKINTYKDMFIIGSHVTINGITFKNDSSLIEYDTSATVITAEEEEDIVISNCKFLDIHLGVCIWIVHSNYIKVYNNVINTYSFGGIMYVNACCFTETLFNDVSNGQYEGYQHRYPISVSGYLDTPSAPAKFVKCNYNRVYESAVWEGIDCHGASNAEFIGNVISGTERGIILTHATSITITGYNRNIIVENNEINCSFMGITVSGGDDDSSARNISIKGNSITCTDTEGDTIAYGCISFRGHASYSNIDIGFNRVSGYRKNICFGDGEGENVNIHDNLILGRSSSTAVGIYLHDLTNVNNVTVENNKVSGVLNWLVGCVIAPSVSLIKVGRNTATGSVGNSSYTTLPNSVLLSAVKPLGKTGDFIPCSTGTTIAGWLCVTDAVWVQIASTSA